MFTLLATALRNDIIDSLRKAAHMREENRSSLRRERDSADGAPSLDELPADASDVSILLEEEEYCRRVWASLAGEPELEEVVRAILDLNLHKPRDIAAAWRYCDLAKEPCAIVWSTDGRIDWSKRSHTFDFRLRKGTPLHKDTFAFRAPCARASQKQPQAVRAALWISEADEATKLCEQSKALPTYNSVISLLWARD